MSPLHHILYPPTKYFVPTPVEDRQQPVLYRIRVNPRQQILNALQSNGGMATITEIYNLTDGDISKSLTQHHLHSMLEEGVVDYDPRVGKRSPKGGRCAAVWKLK